MNNSPTPIIYLLGAGRSGTTVLATVMNAHPNIHTAGELHQFYDHLLGKKVCSCGNSLESCEFWQGIYKQYSEASEKFKLWRETCEEKEAHRNIPKYFISSTKENTYNQIQSKLFAAIQTQTGNDYILDSSKYIARYLLLKRNKNLNVRGIYVVRDVRGVIASFKKKVQSSRSPLSAIFYYLTVNIAAQWVCWLDKGVIKVRYEDFMDDPGGILQQILTKIAPELNGPVSLPEDFEMPHIIGGNRMRNNKTVKLSFDEKWKRDLSKWQIILYYCLASPIMILNAYKI
ncbi:MAG: sulfotransferase [Muriicola sp.]|nr:sulfotransferase [Muriicola sp.]